jgi:RHS repeat-associated protein
VGLEDDSGQLGSRSYEYDPYSEQTNAPSDDPDAKDNPFRFQGFSYDDTVDAYDMQARPYSPGWGRFLGLDVFEDAAGDMALQSDPLTNNRYAFTGGNPINNLEFDGHCAPSGQRNPSPCRPLGRSPTPRERHREAQVNRAHDEAAANGEATAGRSPAASGWSGASSAQDTEARPTPRRSSIAAGASPSRARPSISRQTVLAAMSANLGTGGIGPVGVPSTGNIVASGGETGGFGAAGQRGSTSPRYRPSSSLPFTATRLGGFPSSLFDRFAPPQVPGEPPPSLTPTGARRRGAFRQAKLDAGIPLSQQPNRVDFVQDRTNGKFVRRYRFLDPEGGPFIDIRDDRYGHHYPDDPAQDRGPHFSGPNNTHYDYEPRR